MESEIKLGDLVTYTTVPLSSLIQAHQEDTRQLWLVIGVDASRCLYNLMEYNSIEDIKGWAKNDKPKIQQVWTGMVRKEVFQTHLMNAELHDWFLEKRGAVSAE